MDAGKDSAFAGIGGIGLNGTWVRRLGLAIILLPFLNAGGLAAFDGDTVNRPPDERGFPERSETDPSITRHAVRRAVGEVLASGAYQTDLPATRGSPPVIRVSVSGGGWDGLVRALTWVLVAALVGAAVYRLVDAVVNRRTSAGKPAPAPVGTPLPADRPAAPPGAVDLATADRLAAGGDHIGAVRVLLLLSLDRLDLGRALPNLGLLTNRELTRSDHLPPGARDPFRAIVAVEELGQFGRRPLTEDLYRSCRADYCRLADATGAAA